MREPKQRQGRHIIRPEVCRTFHFGAHGVSNSQYSEYLNSIKLNDIFAPFTRLDLSYLERDKWDATYLAAVRDAPLVTMSSFEEIVGQHRGNGNIHAVRLEYTGFEGGCMYVYIICMYECTLYARVCLYVCVCMYVCMCVYYVFSVYYVLCVFHMYLCFI